MDLADKKYVVVLQCHTVKERCPGHMCEKSFHDRTGGFAAYPKDRPYRFLTLTCGGCCGQAAHRKLSRLVRKMRAEEGLKPEQFVVQLASCITKDNYHSPRCPHADYLIQLIRQLGLDYREDTLVNELSEKRRREGVYPAR